MADCTAKLTPEQRKRWMAARVTHGGYLGGKEGPEHYVWRSMHSRCYRNTDRSYPHYGGRGICVSSHWSAYENFLADMGHRPSPEHSLDRIDNDGPYSKSNCRWATRSEQQKNKTTTRLYTDGSFTGTLTECAARLGVSKELAFYRFKKHGTFKKGTVWLEVRNFTLRPV
jgi:hypothetical protein